MASKFACVFVFILAISSALAITCYKCDSSESSICTMGLAGLAKYTYDDVNCNDDGKGYTGVMNSLLPQQCVKITAKDKNGKDYVARGCLPMMGNAGCNAILKTMGFFGGLGELQDIECYPCEGDKCNSASKINTYTFFGVVFAVFAILF